MTARCILKVIGVLTLVGISIVALAAVLLVGWFLLAVIIPNRMNVTGRVTDNAGRPIRAAQVRAHPLVIFDAHSEDSTKPARGKAQIVFTDEHGRFRLNRLVASGGVKEGMWLQEYDISIKADGYRPAKIRVHNSCDRHKDLITIEDVVLEKEKPAIVSPKAPGFMPGVRNSIPCRMTRHLLPELCLCLAPPPVGGAT